MRRTASVLAAGVLAIGLTGCGDEDTDAGESPRSLADTPSSYYTAGGETVGGPVSGYQTWIGSLTDHDAATACRWQAPELTIELRQQAILVDRARLGDPCVDFEALLWEDPGFAGDAADVEITQQTEEDALLAVTFADGSTQTVRMVYHRAEWRVFSTDERTGEGEPVPGDAAQWVEAWCDLKPSMTREELIAAMGEPSGEYTVTDGGEPQLWWAQDQYDFRAYLDIDGSVLELVGDYDALSEDDRALLPCPELRS